MINIKSAIQELGISSSLFLYKLYRNILGYIVLLDKWVTMKTKMQTKTSLASVLNCNKTLWTVFVGLAVKHKGEKSLHHLERNNLYSFIFWDNCLFTCWFIHSCTHLLSTVMSQVRCQLVKIQRWRWHRWCVLLVVSFVSCWIALK